MGSERGQGTVEWVGTLFVLALLMTGLVAAGVRLPGTSLARALADRVLCAVSMAAECGDEPTLIAAYGTEVGKLARSHMPTLVFERGSRALPVDFRRCRESGCGDGAGEGAVERTVAGLAVTAFVHVVDCRPEAGEASGAECSGGRAGNLYVQFWTYYPESATLRGVPMVGPKGYHRDDWESVQLRFGPDGRVHQRASSHHGYNAGLSVRNWGSDAGSGPLKTLAEGLAARPRNGWGPETGFLFVSGGSHAGNTLGLTEVGSYTPGRRVHLIPLEQLAAASDAAFAVSPPWLKRVWTDPESAHTD